MENATVCFLYTGNAIEAREKEAIQNKRHEEFNAYEAERKHEASRTTVVVGGLLFLNSG